MIKLQGIFAALATPFDDKGAVYKAKLQHDVAKWNRVALAGDAVATRVGEGALLTFEERVEIFQPVQQTAAPRRALPADVTGESVKESLLLAERAAEQRARFSASPAPLPTQPFPSGKPFAPARRMPASIGKPASRNLANWSPPQPRSNTR